MSNSSISPASRNEAISSKPPRKPLHWLRHELHARRRPLRRLPREHVIHHLRVEHLAFRAILFVIVQQPVIRLPSPQDRVDGWIECPHPVIDLAWPAIQPLDIAIGSCDIAVNARLNATENFSASFHERKPALSGVEYGTRLAEPSRSRVCPSLGRGVSRGFVFM